MEKAEMLKVLSDLFHGFADTLLAMADPTAEFSVEQPKQTETEVAAQPPQEEKPLTLEDVRPILAEKSRAGHTAAIRELLKKHGASNLSGIDPAEYPALLADVEAL